MPVKRKGQYVYLSQTQISVAIKELEEKGIIVHTGRYVKWGGKHSNEKTPIWALGYRTGWVDKKKEGGFGRKEWWFYEDLAKEDEEYQRMRTINRTKEITEETEDDVYSEW